MRAQIQDIQGSIVNGKDIRSKGTIFTELIHSNLPPQELRLDRLMDEAAGIVGAGIETTKWATVVTFFHIINNPPVLQRLRQDLEKAIPDPAHPPSLVELEQIPYLMACIEEGDDLLTPFTSPPYTTNVFSHHRPSPVIRRRSSITADIPPKTAPVPSMDHPTRRPRQL
jgi:cytochrome P450